MLVLEEGSYQREVCVMSFYIKKAELDPAKVVGDFRLFLDEVGRNSFKKLGNPEKLRILDIISWEIEKMKEPILEEEREKERRK